MAQLPKVPVRSRQLRYTDRSAPDESAYAARFSLTSSLSAAAFLARIFSRSSIIRCRFIDSVCCFLTCATSNPCNRSRSEDAIEIRHCKVIMNTMAQMIQCIGTSLSMESSYAALLFGSLASTCFKRSNSSMLVKWIVILPRPRLV